MPAAAGRSGLLRFVRFLQRIEDMDLKKRPSIVATPPRHGHPITPGAAEGERDIVDAAIQNQERKQRMINRQRSGREMRISPRQAGNRKKAA